MLACIRDNRHQTKEGQYKPVTCDSTAVLRSHTANRPSTLVQAPYQGVHPCWAALAPNAHACTRAKHIVGTMPVSQRVPSCSEIGPTA
jgi:hypothetical protein